MLLLTNELIGTRDTLEEKLLFFLHKNRWHRMEKQQESVIKLAATYAPSSTKKKQFDEIKQTLDFSFDPRTVTAAPDLSNKRAAKKPNGGSSKPPRS